MRMPTSAGRAAPAAKPDAKGKAANRSAVGAGQARGGADADAFAKRGDDFNLLFAGEVIRAGSSVG